jgi:hypothetical protein
VAKAAVAVTSEHDTSLGGTPPPQAGGTPRHAGGTPTRHAVITPRARHAELATAIAAGVPDSMAGRVGVLTVDDAKGLEFDGVVVLDPAAIVAESPRGANDLYVALTRPTQRLAVLHHGDLPGGMHGLQR